MSGDRPRRRKMRTREHVIADLGVNFVERQILLAGYTAETTRHDYGFDLMMLTYAENGEVENGCIWIQVKASDRIATHAGGLTIPFAVDVVDLNLWLFDPFPVVLVLYDTLEDRAYWVDLQKYVEDARIDIDEVGTSVTIRIPAKDQLSPEAAQEWRLQKNLRLQRRTDGGVS
jgi:hypothetical protein